RRRALVDGTFDDFRNADWGENSARGKLMKYLRSLDLDDRHLHVDIAVTLSELSHLASSSLSDRKLLMLRDATAALKAAIRAAEKLVGRPGRPYDYDLAAWKFARKLRTKKPTPGGGMCRRKQRENTARTVARKSRLISSCG